MLTIDLGVRQYLVSNKYAAPGKVAINGGSNGGRLCVYEFVCLNSRHSPTGLLVAACVNIAAEGTFGAAVAEVGVLDMLKVSCLTLLGLRLTQ